MRRPGPVVAAAVLALVQSFFVLTVSTSYLTLVPVWHSMGILVRALDSFQVTLCIIALPVGLALLFGGIQVLNRGQVRLLCGGAAASMVLSVLWCFALPSVLVITWAIAFVLPPAAMLVLSRGSTARKWAHLQHLQHLQPR